MVFFGWAHAATVPITLGIINFPPGQANVQTYQIDLDSFANTITGIPQISGSPEVFPFDAVTGKGLKKIYETLVGVEVNELMPGVTFRQYVQTGDVFMPSLPPVEAGGIMQGDVVIEGITVNISIDETISPGQVTAIIPMNNKGQSLQVTSLLYSQSNYAPFVIGDNLYAVEPNAPSAGTFQVVKWWQFHDGSTNGVYVAP